MIEKKTYKLYEEFLSMLKISKSSWKRRKNDYLEWFFEYFDYEIEEKRPILIKIKDIYGEYMPLPRKNEEERQKREQDYKNYTIAALGKEFKPNSKARVARNAIADFGRARYGHKSQEAVIRRYVGPIFSKMGEHTIEKVWVWRNSYQLLDNDIILRWRQVLREERIAEDEAAKAFYLEQSGGDITLQKIYYKNAIDRFNMAYGDFPILVYKWRMREVAMEA